MVWSTHTSVPTAPFLSPLPAGLQSPVLEERITALSLGTGLTQEQTLAVQGTQRPIEAPVRNTKASLLSGVSRYFFPQSNRSSTVAASFTLPALAPLLAASHVIVPAFMSPFEIFQSLGGTTSTYFLMAGASLITAATLPLFRKLDLLADFLEFTLKEKNHDDVHYKEQRQQMRRFNWIPNLVVAGSIFASLKLSSGFNPELGLALMGLMTTGVLALGAIESGLTIHDFTKAPLLKDKKASRHYVRDALQGKNNGISMQHLNESIESLISLWIECKAYTITDLDANIDEIKTLLQTLEFELEEVEDSRYANDFEIEKNNFETKRHHWVLYFKTLSEQMISRIKDWNPEKEEEFIRNATIIAQKLNLDLNTNAPRVKRSVLFDRSLNTEDSDNTNTQARSSQGNATQRSLS